MTKTEMKKDIEIEFVEFGVARETGEEYVAEHSFLLPISNGPMVSIPVGARVLVSRQTGEQLFYSRQARPVKLPEVFQVIRQFQKIGPDGEYLNLDVGDILRLTADEAVDLLRRGQVKGKKEE